MAEPSIATVREILKQLRFLSKRGSPEQFLAFVTSLDFREEFEDNDEFQEALEEMEREV